MRRCVAGTEIVVTRIAAVAAIAILITACGADREPPTPARMMSSTELSEALETVKSEVDALVARIAPSGAKRPRFDNEKRQSCVDIEGAPSGAVRSQFGYIVDARGPARAELLAAAEEFFSSRRMTVNAEHVTDDPPALFATDGGFSYSAVVNSVGEIVVGGTTPCFLPG
jgi:hypothetical protein